jgi:hypothetical protein
MSAGGVITGDWTLSPNTFSVARYGLAAVAYANNLYIFGGNDYVNSAYMNDSQFASLGYKTGTICQSSSSTSCSGVSGNQIFGSGTTFNAAMVGSTLQYPDGSTATITAFGSATNVTVSISKVVSSGSIYVIQDGSVGTWSYTTSTPTPVLQMDAVAANGYVYLVGGRYSAGGCPPNVLVAPISANTTVASGNNPTGVGEWSETAIAYAGGRYGAGVAYDKGKLYISGGGCESPQAGTFGTGTVTQSGKVITCSCSDFSDNAVGSTLTITSGASNGLTARVVSKLSTGNLVLDTSRTVSPAASYTLTAPRHQYATLKSQPQVAKYSRLIDADTDVFPTKWLLNGLDNSIGARWQLKYKSMHDIDPVVVGGSDSAKFSAGSITQTSAGSPTFTITGTGTGWTSAVNGGTIVYADASTATVTYVNATTLTSSVSKNFGTAQNYTIYVLQRNPVEDCGVSSTSATMTTYGTETNFGNVTLGTPQTYTARDGSNANMNCARYFYISVSIDSSKAFGYPEDVTRGPTISDITLLFTSDPSKRLMHGRTFTGGEQQPLDAPF